MRYFNWTLLAVLGLSVGLWYGVILLAIRLAALVRVFSLLK